MARVWQYLKEKIYVVEILKKEKVWIWHCL
jgi:hypothetical protein